MNWTRKEDFLKEVGNHEANSTEVNWSDMARKYEVQDGNGEIAKNGGQITKGYAKCKGINADSISKKRKHGNVIVRKYKKRFIRTRVSVPVDCSNIQLKDDLGKRIRSGEYSIGVPIYSPGTGAGEAGRGENIFGDEMFGGFFSKSPKISVINFVEKGFSPIF